MSQFCSFALSLSNATGPQPAQERLFCLSVSGKQANRNESLGCALICAQTREERRCKARGNAHLRPRKSARRSWFCPTPTRADQRGCFPPRPRPRALLPRFHRRLDAPPSSANPLCSLSASLYTDGPQPNLGPASRGSGMGGPTFPVTRFSNGKFPPSLSF